MLYLNLFFKILEKGVENKYPTQVNKVHIFML